jgi:hypothetical protein
MGRGRSAPRRRAHRAPHAGRLGVRARTPHKPRAFPRLTPRPEVPRFYPAPRITPRRSRRACRTAGPRPHARLPEARAPKVTRLEDARAPRRPKFSAAPCRIATRAVWALPALLTGQSRLPRSASWRVETSCRSGRPSIRSQSRSSRRAEPPRATAGLQGRHGGMHGELPKLSCRRPT